MPRQGSLLMKELQQNKPFRSVYHEAGLAILKTADVLRREFARRLEPHEITPQQYNVLRILRGAGTAGMPTLEIGERLIEDTPGMTRLLDRLESKQLVRRARCKHDRRQVLCHLSEAGQQILEALDPLASSAEDAMAGYLSEAEAESLVELLERIREIPR